MLCLKGTADKLRIDSVLRRWLNVSSNSLQWFDYAFIPKQLEWIDIHQVRTKLEPYRILNQQYFKVSFLKAVP